MIKSKNKIPSILLGAIMLVALLSLNLTAYAADTVTKEFSVATEEAFISAIDEINAAESGEFVIELTADIELTKEKNFTKNTTTILGQGHTIYVGANSAKVFVRGDGKTPWEDVVLNLGSPDGSDTLTIKGTKADGTDVTRSSSAMVQCQDATLNMYDGVTIQKATKSGGGGAGVFVNGNFNMYGGSITDNFIQSIVGGGGIVMYEGTVNMYGGSITNNIAETSRLYCLGGGVLLYPTYGSCSFNMYGGTISGNLATNYGGGIAAISRDEEMASYINLYGGEIINNIVGKVGSEAIGGGVYAQETAVTIAPQAGKTVTITGNTNAATNMDDNLALGTNNYSEDEASEPIQDKIKIGTLTEGTQIGITLGQPTTEIEFTKDYRLTNPDTLPEKFFTSDNPDYVIEDWYASDAAEPSEVRLAKYVTFETMADAGYYSEAINSDDKSGVVSLNVWITNFDSIRESIVEYGLYVTSDKDNAKEVAVVSSDVEQLDSDKGYYHAIVNNISPDDFEAVFSGVPFIRIDTDGISETTDDRRELIGDAAAATSVSAINKWLGPVNEYE